MKTSEKNTSHVPMLSEYGQTRLVFEIESEITHLDCDTKDYGTMLLLITRSGAQLLRVDCDPEKNKKGGK